MENAIVQAGARGLQLQNYNDMYRFAKVVVDSGFAPKDVKTAESALVAIQMGAELGLAPMQALQNVAVINGRPAIWGDAMKAVCVSSPLCEDFQERVEGEGDKMAAVCEIKRRGMPTPVKATFTVADAKKAGLWGKAGPWTQYPQRMLQMRARSFACRDAFPDLLRGFQAAEEARDIPTQPQRVEAEVVDEPHVEYDEAAQLRAENQRRYHHLKQNLTAFDAAFFNAVAADNGYPAPKDCTQEQVAELLTIVEEAAEFDADEAAADA